MNTKVETAKNIKKIYEFHDMLYYMLVTLGTIGFGDITPVTTLGRFAMIITITLILALVPTLSQKLFTILALTTKYSRISYRKFSKDTKHLILLGSCGVEGFEAFLNELYHEDHGNVDYQSIIMQSYPNEDFMFLINQSNFSNKIFYLVGNSLVHKDLLRCKAESAGCVILLANKLAKNPKYEDFSNILQAFSIKKFSTIYSGNDVRICIQLLRPETKEIYFSSLINEDDNLSKDQVICVEEIKLQLLGKSCLCPGINTIISSLITSNKPSLNDAEILSNEMNWIHEYVEGMQNEIYRIRLNADIIQGIKFIDLVKIIYEISGLTVIGVDVIFETIEPFVCLNPYSYIFAPFDHSIYVLADKLPDTNQINERIKSKIKTEERESNLEYAKLLKIKNSGWDDKKEDRSKQKTRKLFAKLKKKEANKHFKINFIQTTFPRTGHEAENFSTEILTQHIIVCGLIHNMKNLILPLRAVSMKNQQHPILIIDKEDHIPSEIWKDIQYFPDIYYMQGTPIKSKDLHRACIKKAKAVIILSKLHNYDEESHNMVDADTIFIYKAIRNENKNVLIITDLASLSTIGFISSNDNINYKKQGYRLSEQFAVGEIYTSSMLDTLMCQAFFNPYITDILQQLILGSASFDYSPILIKKLKERKVTQSTLYLLDILEELEKIGKKNLPKKMLYEELFNSFVENNMVPIGIYRNIKGSGPKINKTDKYVFMCPSKNTEIYIKDDRIYVLASEEEPTDFNRVNNKTRDVSNFHNKNLKLIEKSSELAGRLSSNIKELLDHNQECLKTQFSVKKITDLARISLRKEFANIYDYYLPK
jgi:potassium large conductance calcium-activated channel subfamily M alpha protein 1